MKAQTTDGTVSVRAENTNFLSADAEGKATGNFTVNAKAVTIKSMDVDKDSLADSALAASSTMVLLSEKMYVEVEEGAGGFRGDRCLCRQYLRGAAG